MRKHRFWLALLPLAVGCSATGGPAGTKPAPVGGRAAPSPGSLDEILLSSWQKAQVKIAPPAEGGEFLRRASLDLIGRVPTLAEARDFLADGAPDRHARLVDRLLASPELAEHLADVYSDLLWRSGEGRQAQRINRQDPRSWLVSAFAENRPYDRIVWDLLTASGDVSENGAAAFIAARARGGGGPEAMAGSAARLFLGLQIQCAQCHDHPYDSRWKQEDFYGLVAYFARTKVKREKKPDLAGLDPAMDMSGMDEPAPRARGPSFVVFDQRRGEARMRPPRSEMEVPVAPRFLGRATPGLSEEGRRTALARAVIESDLFPKAMVARTWAQLFGQSMVDAWDDLGAENHPDHPPLLVGLARDFRASGFDVKALLRRIVLSPAYARSSARPAGGSPDGTQVGSSDGANDGAALHLFARARVRPLSSEQLFRTLLTASGAGDMIRHRTAARGPGAAERQIERALREYRFTFEDDEMADADTFDGSMPQALLLLNGEVSNGGARAGQGGVLGGILRATRDPAQRLDQMFQAVYSRSPTPEETAWLLPQLTAAREDRRLYEDAFFSLLISSEAVTNH